MGSRLRESPSHIFECFFEVVIPNENEKKPWILQKYPEDFNDQEVLKSVPVFACPCEFTNLNIQHFSFVLTSLDSKWSFGYCRHVPKAQTLFVLLSHLPWHETFYKTLDQVSTLTNENPSLLLKFLEAIYNAPVPFPGLNLHISYCEKEFIVYCPNHLKLPSIPENRNLTEYFNAIDAHNMMNMFASMLHERRIIVTSNKLSRLSACVQAANSLIYPMHWQHIFIPVLPKHLIDYLSAPMPFLIGVPTSTMMLFRQSELGEVVILDADNNRIKTPFNDLEMLPPDILSSLKRSLKNPNLMLGDGVSRAFMRALVKLIGGYRDCIKVALGEKISFDADAFIQTRSSSVQPFLEKMLQLQIFQQFIENRLDMLNSGIGFNDEFEYEVNTYEVHSSNNIKTQYKEWVSTMKKEGGAFLKNVKSKTNPAVKHAYKSVKNKSKRAYKDIRSRIHDIQKHPGDLHFDRTFKKPKSAPSSPTSARANFISKRMSYNPEDESKSSVLDGRSVPHSGIRRYKMLTVDELSSDDFFDDADGLGLQKMDMNLMDDMKEVIFRRCSVSSDNLPSFGKVIEDISEEPFGFTDSFCDGNKNISTPIPPPRTKKIAKPYDDKKNLSTDKPLIELGSLDEVALFDPLKEDNAKDTELLPFLSQSATSDSRVTELKNTIQNLTLNPNKVTYFPNHMGTTMPRYVMPSVIRMPMPNVVQSNGFSNFQTPGPPPLPPKTKLSNSTFFISTEDMSNADKDLLDDYGLGNSPLFKKDSQQNIPEQSIDPFEDLTHVPKALPRQKKDSHLQPTWQKFA